MNLKFVYSHKYSSYVLPPQYLTNAFSDTRPRNNGVYVTLNPHGRIHAMNLAALDFILSEYCPRDMHEFNLTVSVTKSFPSFNKPTSLNPRSMYSWGIAISMKLVIDVLDANAISIELVKDVSVFDAAGHILSTALV